MAKAIVVAAPASGSGKTLLTLSLLRALRDRGLRVASAKVGPDHIDPRFHEAATGLPCFNLDPWAMSPGQIGGLMASLGQLADYIIIEGVMGLFDGPAGASGSTADLARLLGLPVVLVVDASHQAQSVAALVHGFSTFSRDIAVAGVILNRVASGRHDSLLRSALTALPAVQVLGTVRRIDSLALPSRHLGLVQAQENQLLESFLASAALTVARETILDNLLTMMMTPVIRGENDALLAPPAQRIAVAEDIAFSFAYPHLLHTWRRQGAEITLFSPLADEPAPASAEAVILPGGYPELHAGRLAANTGFLTSLRQSQALIYGECGGYMVLGDALVDAEGTAHAMAGLLPLTTSFATRSLHLGYRKLQPVGGLWTKPLSAHEFHYSTVVSQGAAEPLFHATDASGQPLGPIGLRRGKVSGSYAHIICEAA